MKNFKVRCTDDSGKSNTKGKIYEVKDGILPFDDGNDSTGATFESVAQINRCLMSKFELVEENMTKDDLKVGYVVERRDGTLKMLMPAAEGTVFYGNGTHHTYDGFSEDLKSYYGTYEFDIIRVWGYARSPENTLDVSADDRPLLWERHEEPIKITSAEVFEILAKAKGCTVDRVEIVGDMK